MSAAIIIFARYDSRRLPGKALRDLVGRSLLARVFDRAQQVPGNYPVVLATSDRDIDNPLADLADGEGIGVFRGHATDVLARCLACAESLGVTRVARITGDSPFFNPRLIHTLIELSEDKLLDVATNVFPRTFPPGASAEIITASALRRAAEYATDPADREHMTGYFYRNPTQFRIENVTASQSIAFAGVSLAVDTEEDLQRATWIVEHMSQPPEQVAYEQILELARIWRQENVAQQ